LLTRKLGLLEKSEASCCGVTLSQCHAIVEIGRAGSISVNDLANILGLDKSTMSRAINNLVELDLVTREAVPDNRRLLSIGLTTKGRTLFSEIESSMEQYYHDVYSALPADKRTQVIESLELLVRTIPGQCC
jgi:DNA-binding MarR family transcriptional regulator